MKLRNKIILIAVVSIILMGSVYAQKNVNEFQVNKRYNSIHNGSFSLYSDEKHDSGIAVYKNLNSDIDENDAHDDLVHDQGRDYLTGDDDYKIDKNPNNIANFTDGYHDEHGACEVVKCKGREYVVVCWGKDDSNVSDKYFVSQLDEFNKANNVTAVPF